MDKTRREFELRWEKDFRWEQNYGKKWEQNYGEKRGPRICLEIQTGIQS